jgi:hypothetical protein
MQTQKTHSQAKAMQKYVLILVGVWSLLAVTFPIALKRVSQSEKFAGFHVKSLTLEGQLPSKR